MTFKKRIRRLILILVSIWFLTIIVGLVFSRSIQNKVIEALTKQADRHLLAEIQVRKGDIHFSVFKKFPLASVELRNILVKVPVEFDLNSLTAVKSDTLLFAEKVFLQMDLLSLFKQDYQLKKISVDDGFLQVMTDKNGMSSLNIFRPGNSDKNFKANIESFLANNVTIYNSSSGSKNTIHLKLKKAVTNGEFADDNFYVKVQANGLLEQLHVQGEELKPMQKFKLSAALEKKENSFLLNGGEIVISNIPLKIGGSITDEKNTYIDLILSTHNASIKQIDQSLLSGFIGNSGLEPRSGQLNVNATVKGNLKDSPAVNAKFTVNGGKFYDNQRSLSYEKVYFKGELKNINNKRNSNNYRIAVDTFNFSCGESFQHGNLVITGFKKTNLDINISGEFAIKDLIKFIPENNFGLNNGRINNRLSIQTELTNKSDKQKSKVKVTGYTHLNNIVLQLPGQKIPALSLNGNCYLNSINDIKLDTLSCKAANSDLSIKGRLLMNQSGAYPFDFRGTLMSKELYVDDFLSPQSSEKTEAKPVEFPDSIRFDGYLDIKKLYFGKFHPEKISAKASYLPGRLKVNGIKLAAFSGTATGDMQLLQHENDDIQLIASANIKKSDIEQMFEGFNSFGQDIIGKDNLKGSISGKIDYLSTWSPFLEIDLNSIVAKGSLLLVDGELNNYEPLLGLSKFIHVSELQNVKFDNLETNIGIRNRKVMLDQTEIHSSALSFSGSGVHDFDNKYEYRLQVGLSDILWNKAHKKRNDISEFGYVDEGDKDKTLIPLVISGIGSSFDVKYDRKTSRTNFKERVAREKVELQKLIHDTAVEESFETADSRDTISETTQKLKKTDSGMYRSKSSNFILEWDDSEDEGDE